MSLKYIYKVNEYEGSEIFKLIIKVRSWLIQLCDRGKVMAHTKCLFDLAALTKCRM